MNDVNLNSNPSLSDFLQYCSNLNLPYIKHYSTYFAEEIKNEPLILETVFSNQNNNNTSEKQNNLFKTFEYLLNLDANYKSYNLVKWICAYGNSHCLSLLYKKDSTTFNIDESIYQACFLNNQYNNFLFIEEKFPEVKRKLNLANVIDSFLNRIKITIQLNSTEIYEPKFITYFIKNDLITLDPLYVDFNKKTISEILISAQKIFDYLDIEQNINKEPEILTNKNYFKKTFLEISILMEKLNIDKVINQNENHNAPLFNKQRIKL